MGLCGVADVFKGRCVCVRCVFPGVLGWAEAGAAKVPGTLEKNPKIFPLLPFPATTKGHNWVVLCNSLYEEISVTSDHTCICVSPVAVIMV